MSTTLYLFGTVQLGRAQALDFGTALLAALLLALLAAKPAHAATFTVNSIGDQADAITNNVCDVDPNTFGL